MELSAKKHIKHFNSISFCKERFKGAHHSSAERPETCDWSSSRNSRWSHYGVRLNILSEIGPNQGPLWVRFVQKLNENQSKFGWKATKNLDENFKVVAHG